MGIFNRKKDRFQEIQEDENWIGEERNPIFEEQYHSTDRRYTITIFGKRKELEIQHRNKERTNLILAKAMKVRDGDVFVIDAADDIAFEIKDWQDMNDRNILQAVANQYERQAEVKNEVCHYLGIVDYTERGYEITKKSQKVQEYINQQIVPRILEEREIKRQRKLASYREIQETQKEESRKFRERLNAVDYIKSMEQLKKQRMVNPYLEKTQEYKIDGRTYEDYNGVNIFNGEVLKIRKLDKVGKDELTGNYLYQGYIQSTPNEDDVEILAKGRPFGANVCFEVPERLSDLEKMQNPFEIDRILALLSRGVKLQTKELEYIGKIDKDWRVDYQSEPTSAGIKTAVQALKDKFNEKYNRNHTGKNYGD